MKRDHVLTYHERLNADRTWARSDADAYFSRKGSVFDTVRFLVDRLDANQAQYCFHGIIGLYFHKFRRFTEGIELGMNIEDCRRLADRLGLEQRSTLDSASAKLIHRVTRIEINVLDWRALREYSPTFAAFANNADGIMYFENYPVLNLTCLIENELSRGRQTQTQWRTCAIQDAIKSIELPAEFAEILHPSFRDEYRTLWNYAQLDRKFHDDQ